MKRLDLSKIVVDTTSKRDLLLKTTLQLPTEFRGIYKNNLLCPINYIDVSDGTIFIDDNKNEYKINGNLLQKNGDTVFTFDPTHLEKTETENIINRDIDGGAIKNGSVITYGTYTINVVDCGYDYFLCTSTYDGNTYITLFPSTPTKYKEILSWKLGGGTTVQQQHSVFISPFHEVIIINNNKCSVAGNYICDILFKDMIMSGDNNHILFTAENDDGYFYSNLEYSDKTFLTSNCLLLATSQDGIYYGGFKVKKGDWSIDYYNNIPVQVSYKNKVMINQVDYAYFNSNNTPIVIIDEKAYKLEIKDGAEYSIVADRYFIVNSPNTRSNTYDFNTGKSFCRNSSYCGSVLWIVPENSLVSNTESEERKTFYVATGININGQVNDTPVQGTIWPSFPVWGLKDNNFQLLDIYNDEEYNIIEVYKGTKDSPLTPTFSFCIGGFKDYTGYVYPDSNNTLYSVTEIDTFTETNNGLQLVNTPSGIFIASMSNRQLFTFSYYLGTLSEFKQVFILQGTVYGITDSGYIVRMVLQENILIDTALVTKIGNMKFLGNTQEYALFYSELDKSLYTFNSSYKVSFFKEFTIGDPKYFTCRPQDDRIAIATEDNIFLVYKDGITKIEVKVNQLRYCGDLLLAGDKAFSYYGGDKTLTIEYDTGRIGNAYDNTIQISEICIMLDKSDLKVPGWLNYRIDVGDSIGELQEIVPDNINNIIRLKPTTDRSEGLYYRIWLNTNCNILGISVVDNSKDKPNLTSNNG